MTDWGDSCLSLSAKTVKGDHGRGGGGGVSSFTTIVDITQKAVGFLWIPGEIFGLQGQKAAVPFGKLLDWNPASPPHPIAAASRLGLAFANRLVSKQ